MAKHDAKGRTKSGRRNVASAGKPISTDLREVRGIPDGEPFVLLTLGLLLSPQWRGQSIKCRRFIEFLIKEHLAHGRAENGNLAAPYAQLHEWGIGKQYIHPAIDEAVERGLVEVTYLDSRKGAIKKLSRYRLTWLPSREIGHDGQPYFAQPTFLPRSTETVDEKARKQNAGIQKELDAPLDASSGNKRNQSAA